MPPTGKRAFAAVVLGIFAVSAAACGQSPTEQLGDLIDEYWEFRLAESPLLATSVGDHRAGDRLDRVSVADADRRADRTAKFLDRLQAIDRDGLEPDGRTNLTVLERQLQDDLAEHSFNSYLMPISNRSGFHIHFPELRRQVPLVSTEDYQNYIARLAAFAEYADQHIHLMRDGVRQGYTPASVIMEGTEDAISAHVVKEAEQSLMYEPLQKIPATVPAREHERLREAAREAIRTSVVPGYDNLLKFMKEEYLPQCRATVAARALPDGAAFYRFRVRKFTTLDDATPQSIHAQGLSEVARIRGEMEAIIREVGFEGDFQEFVAMLREDPQFYAETPEELLQECALILKRIDGELPRLFQRLPRMPYGLRPVPEYIAAKTTSAYYQPPAGDASRAGVYFLNTYNLSSRPLYMLEALSLHEAVPGHHLQIALQQELEGLPEFRKFTGFTVFVEGWALYAERLGLEVGFYEDPYSDFGRLSMEIWRACRLVVDTGVHYLGWSREKAIAYMKENSALSEHNIRAEVDRYIGWPGQALAYKTGELKIRELRTLAEGDLGDQFDLRSFHDMLLGSGAVPLDVLEEKVRSWIAEQRAKTRS